MRSRNCKIPAGRTFFCFIVFLSLITRLVDSSCPNLCSGHGECDKFSSCNCYSGYQGADCSEHICPFGRAWTDIPSAKDTAHNLAECSNRGLCNRLTGVCECQTGFLGTSCNRLDCSNKCGGNGQCLTMSERAHRYTDASGNSYAYESVWDASMIKGCVCDAKYGNYDCSQRLCPTGDDPLTTLQTNQIQLLQCTATSGSFVLYFNAYPSLSIPYTANAATLRLALLSIPTLTDLKITFSPGSTTVCSISPNIVQIEFIQQFGQNPTLIGKPDLTMSSIGGTVVISNDGSTVYQDYKYTSYKSITGTKENKVCSGRGLCAVDGVCACFATNGDSYVSSNGYGGFGTRGDCGKILSGATVATCPGSVQCSGHGLCSKATKVCSCQSGWEGGDCSQRSCPTGLSWFDYPKSLNTAHTSYSICSNMGTCDYTTGSCQCNELFEGQACERLRCPGGCNGHGTCMTMSQIALHGENNGNLNPLSYGSNPNLASTWDARRTQSCLCDRGWKGYDCSLRTCIAGDDGGTHDDHVEVQLLQCRAKAGSFKLSFRQFTTSSIPYSATASDLKAALEALPSIIGRVDVWFLQDIISNNITIPPRTFSVVSASKETPQGFPSWAEFNRSSISIPKRTTTTTFIASTSLTSTLEYTNMLYITIITIPPVSGMAVTYENVDFKLLECKFDTLSVGGRGTCRTSTFVTIPLSPPVTLSGTLRIDQVKGVEIDAVTIDSIPPYPTLTPICTTTGTQLAIISFASTHGDIPPITIDSQLSNIGSTVFTQIATDGNTVQVGGKVFASVKGSTEVAVCNNRGLCDTTTGMCTCFPTWSSSDGAGGPGRLNDCGYRNQKLYSFSDSYVQNMDHGGSMVGKGQYEGRVGPGQEERNMGPLDLRGK